MVDLLSNYIFFNLEDQVYLLTFGFWSKRYLVEQGSLFFNPSLGLHGFEYNIFGSNQPLIWGIVGLGYFFFNPILFYNLFIIFTFILNFVFSYKFFRFLSGDNRVSLIQSVLFSFSPYAIIHSGRHLDLALVFLLPVYFYVLIKYVHYGNNFDKGINLLILLTIFQSLLSNYYGFFMLMFFYTYFLVRFIIGLVNSGEKLGTDSIKGIARYSLVVFIVLSVILLPYIKVNYFDEAHGSNYMLVDRAYEDYFYFSSRPWYFVLPPVKNPFIGHYSQRFLEYLVEKKDYFLFDDYFYGEHAGNYIGFVTLGFVLLALVLRDRLDKDTKSLISVFFILGVILVLFSMPPFFTVSGIKIYTPGELFFKLFPMFRAMTRLSVLVLLCLLVVSSFSMKYVFEKINRKWVSILCVGTLLFVGVFESITPIKYTNVRVAPEEFKYLESVTEKNTKVAFYPSSSWDILWHSRLNSFHFINPDSYSKGEFVSRDFTDKIPTEGGFLSLKDYNTDLLVVNKEIDQELLEVFLSSEVLKVKEEFDDVYVMEVQ